MPKSLSHGEYQAQEWRARLGETTFVYVIQARAKTPIKIGIARNPAMRLRTLQTGNPERLRLLYVVPGARALEADFHRRLKRAKVMGEWFGGAAAEEFLGWVKTYSADALTIYDETGKLPEAQPRPKPRTPKRPDSTLTVRHVEPNPVSPEEAQRRLASRWMRPARTGSHASPGTTGTIN